MERADIESLINQELPDNLQQLITAAVLRSVLNSFLANAVLQGENADGVQIQFSNSVFEIDWSNERASNNIWWRVSHDNGGTWSASIYDPNYLFDRIKGGTVPANGDTLLKINNRIALNETDIANLQTAVAASPDELQNLQDLLTMLENNPETVGEALANKLETSIWNTFINTTFPQALAGKASSIHSHIIDNIQGLRTALEGKAPASHAHTKEAVQGWGFYSADQIDLLLAAIENNLPDVEGDASFTRRRLSVAYFDGDFGYDQVVIKVGRTESDAIFSGALELTVLLHLFNIDVEYVPVTLKIAGNVSGGVWQSASCSANAITPHITSVKYYHTATDLYLLLEITNIDTTAPSLLCTDMICKATTAAGLINSDDFETQEFLPASPTLDITQTIFQPLTDADIEPFTF